MLIALHSFSYLIGLTLLIGSSVVAGEQIHNPIRFMQMSPLETLAYSSYTSVQIFHLLNWQQNDKIIKSINQEQGRTFIAAHNQFSYLSIREIQ